MNRYHSFILYIGLLVLLSCQESPSQKQFKIGFSQCCNDQWREVMEKEMHREMDFHPNVELLIKVAETNSQKQVQQIQELVEEEIDLLIVAPNESVPLTAVIEKVYQQGIPVILVDRETESNEYTTYVGANNYEIGRTAGHYIASQNDKQGKIIELMLPQSITPGVGRSSGFREALKQYPDMEIIAALDGGWTIENVNDSLPTILEAYPEANIIYGHTDILAERAYQIAKNKGQTDQFFYLGIDGLAGKNGGIQMVQNGILNASLLYPTGGAESIKAAIQILNNFPVEKRIELYTTVIDPDNARIINRQMEKVLSLQENISQQKSLVQELQSIYYNQQMLIYILIGSLLLTLILGGSFWRSSKLRKEANEKLQQRNQEVEQQKKQLVNMSAQVEKATKAKVDFFTNISHEFKTPLTLIMGFSEDLLPSPKLSPDMQQGIFLIKENAKRLLRLVNQLMDFRKLESTGLKIQASENDLVAFVTSIVASYQQVAGKKNIDLQLTAKPRKIKVWYDRDMLDKVLFNILSNAFKFTPDGGRIHIYIGKDRLKNNCFIQIEDQGIGMDEETLQHIFDPFYQGAGSEKGGTGLGLPLSKKLIHLHKGDIQVQSRKEKGSRFTVQLPLGKEHFSMEERLQQFSDFEDTHPKSTVAVTSTQLNKVTVTDKEPTILIIEDNPDIQFFLKKKFQSIYNLLTATDGLQGIELAYEHIPDLVICDIKLPSEDGLSITKQLKQDLRTSHIPILLLTARSSLEQQIEGTKSGADAYITKPFNIQYLREKIKNLLLNRQILKESYAQGIRLLQRKKSVSKLDTAFIERFVAYIENNYHRQDFQVSELCDELNLSRSQLYRKAKALIGQTIGDYIQTIRLAKAEELLKKGNSSISEIAYQVGYSSPEYFSTVFKNKFGTIPSKYAAK